MKALLLLMVCGLTVFGQTNSLPMNRQYAEVEVGKVTYTNATVKALNPIDGIVTFSGGGSKIKLEDLRGQPGADFYNEAKADAFRAQLARNEERRQSVLKDAARRQVEQYKQVNIRIVDGHERNIADATLLDGKISQVLKARGGVTLQLYQKVWKGGWGHGNGNFLGGGSGHESRELSEIVVFVKLPDNGLLDGLSDDQNFAIKAFPSSKTIQLQYATGGVGTLKVWDRGDDYKSP